MKTILEPLAELKSEGKRIVGCFPLYPPLELIHSMGLVPVVLWGFKPCMRQVPASDRHLQNYACSVARHLVECLLQDQGRHFDGLVMYNACDTLRNLPEILEAGLDGHHIPLYSLHVPALPMDRSVAREYLAGRIQDFILWMETTFRKGFSPESFRNSTALYSRMRRLMALGQDLAGRGKASFARYAALCREINFLPVEKQIAALERFCQEAEKTLSQADGKTRIVLSGILPPPDEILQAMEEAGLLVAANDAASLHRSCAVSPEATDDPAAYYTEFYGSHFPCTTLLPLADKRLEALLALVENSGASGFVFAGEKFCEYEYFEHPFLEKTLRKKGIRTLALEFSLGDGRNQGAVKTRIEAFAEIMNAQ